MGRFPVAAIVALLILVAATAAHAQSARVVALTVGVNKYDNLGPDLSKAVPDAEAVHRILTADLKIAAANVLIRRNATGSDILDAWDEVLAKLAMRTDGIAIFHFAGHGVELRGQNLLIPRDARMDDQGTLKKSSVELQELFARLAKVQEKQKSAIGIFIIDACRENPVDLAKLGGDAAPGFAAPLANLPRSVFLIYSAGIGQNALDGDGQNSVFMSELLPLLGQFDPQLPLSDLAQALRYRVYSAASQFTLKGEKHPHRQTPAYYDQLLQRTTLIGNVIVGSEVVPVKVHPANAAARRIPVQDLGTGDLIIDCPMCPELIVIPRRPDGQRLAVGRFEITKGQWNACVADGQCSGQRDISGSVGNRDSEALADVSWHGAQAYLAWLNGRAERPAQRYRLATEQEWEFAARGGEPGSSFPLRNGETICSYANLADETLGSLLLIDRAHCSDGARGVTVVGRYKANGYGLYDVLGNVWEWTQSCSTPQPDGAATSVAPPKPPVCARYVARGGSWRSPEAALTFTARQAFAPTHVRSTLGFRVVLDLGE